MELFWGVHMKLARINFHQDLMDSWLLLKETGYHRFGSVWLCMSRIQNNHESCVCLKDCQSREDRVSSLRFVGDTEWESQPGTCPFHLSKWFVSEFKHYFSVIIHGITNILKSKANSQKMTQALFVIVFLFRVTRFVSPPPHTHTTHTVLKSRNS